MYKNEQSGACYWRRVVTALTLLLLCCFSTFAESRELSSEGYGENVAAARNEALSALASSIFVHIESSSKGYEDTQGENRFSSTTQSSTDLPLIGVEFDCYAALEQQLCVASLDTESSLKLYQARIEGLVQDINESYEEISNISVGRRYEFLLDILSKYKEHERYTTVLLFMSGSDKTLLAPSVSKWKLEEDISVERSSVSSLSLAARLLTEGVDDSSVYIQPAMYKDSREVTEFAGALLEEMKHQMSSMAQSTGAKYIYSGSYLVNKEGIKVSFSLSEPGGNIVKTRLVDLQPASYKKYDVEPRALDFDRLLHQGYAVASDFKVQVATTKGQRLLLFREGEEVEVIVKINKPGYFYVAGHIKTEEQELSYLLDLADVAGDRRFIYFVNADEVNKWVSLGKFAVHPPYGIESLQVLASPDDLVDSLPAYAYDPDSQYYVLSGNIKKGVAKTRGLKRKKPDANGVESTSEAVLLFTTRKKTIE